MIQCFFKELIRFNNTEVALDRSSANISPLNPSLVILEDWTSVLTYGKGKLYIIPAAFFLLALLMASPIILLAIFSNQSLYQETRYRLLANTLISDLIYSVVNLIITATNIAPFLFPKIMCQILLGFLTMTYYNGVLNITAMVVDLYLAVNWPLHYNSLLPPRRAIKMILCIWGLSALTPIVTYIIMSAKEDLMCAVPVCFNYFGLVIMFCSCFVVIVGCYYTLYWRTRHSGIWNGTSSRGRQTFLIHSLLFVFYLFPVIILITEKILLTKKVMNFFSLIYVTMTMSNIVMMLPKALTPYLYGLRYRDLVSTKQGIVENKPHLVYFTLTL
uniref:G-protein coupled receptors family 1 profile domain-containing protein n=1 Tax=Erpetoichthys calabaricus TaxID=27687 RepID=A0A8C4T9G2_ERPCA